MILGFDLSFSIFLNFSNNSFCSLFKYTGTSGSTQLTGITRAARGSTRSSHLNGATVSNMGPNARSYRFRAVGGADTRIDYVSTAAFHPYIAKDGSAVASLSHGSNPVLDGGVNRSAVRVKENSFAVSINGSAVSGSALDTSGAWPPTNAIDELNLGGNTHAGSMLIGHMRRFMYYSVGLPNSQLVTLTS